MGHLVTAHSLTWRMLLTEYGYTCYELMDKHGRRWGYVINAGSYGWDAHVGSFGQAAAIGLSAPPISDAIVSKEYLAEAKEWVEQSVATAWKRQGDF